MSGIQETNNKCWLKLTFVFICVFLHRNKFKRLHIITVPSLTFILRGIPIAAREKVGLQAVQKELYVIEIYFIFLSHLQVSGHHRCTSNICGAYNLL